jgi:uncharacterized protein YkuJ
MCSSNLNSVWEIVYLRISSSFAHSSFILDIFELNCASVFDNIDMVFL